MILASCAVLRIHNYDRRGNFGEHVTLKTNLTPGQSWNQAVQAGSPSHPVVLGYNVDPTFQHIARAIAEFFETGAGSPSDWPQNWILANTSQNVLQGGGVADADGACALDYNQDYWFVRSSDAWDDSVQTLWHVNRHIGHVAKSEWNDLSTNTTIHDRIIWTNHVLDKARP